MEEGKYSTFILVFSFIGALLSINLVAKNFRIIFYSTMFLTLLKGFIPTEVEVSIVYFILFILLVSFGNQKNIKIDKEHIKEISQRIALILFTMVSTIIILINDIIFRIDMYINSVDSVYSNTFGFVFFIVGSIFFIIGIYLMIKSTYLILERLLIDYYIDFYDYVSKYNYAVVNDEVDTAVTKIEGIIAAEKCRVDRIKDTILDSKEGLIHEQLYD